MSGRKMELRRSFEERETEIGRRLVLRLFLWSSGEAKDRRTATVNWPRFAVEQSQRIEREGGRTMSVWLARGAWIEIDAEILGNLADTLES